MSDVIGSRGEAIFFVALTRLHGRPEPLFRPQFLGDKFPGADYLVVLTGIADASPFFLAQIKTTRRGYTRRDARLRVGLSNDALGALQRFPVPTYLFGVDEQAEAVFILSANGESAAGFSSFPTDHPLDRARQDRMWGEVWGYWQEAGQLRVNSAFTDPKWSLDDGR